jgi:D-alanyl-D-alanine dipeptidase
MKYRLSLSAILRIALIFFVSSFILLPSGCSSGSGKKENPYDLNIVSSLKEYRNSIAADSSNMLVDLEDHIPGIMVDIRYADTNNFTHTAIYTLPKAYLRRPAADSLLKVQQLLSKMNLGIKVFDAYRPYAATLYFYEVCGDTTFVAAPWKGSIHNRGCAVDLTLVDLSTGEELQMPTAFDEFSPAASHNYMELDSTKLANRALLLKVMTENGFTMYEYEWWHYNIKGRDKYSLMDISFEELEKLKK